MRNPSKINILGRNRKRLPILSVCRNCGTQQISRYCHNCGQDLFSGSERSLKEITGNFMATILAWDNKLITTLKYLVFFPGKLTKEFFAGRIASYVYPAKLFWFMSILFFATLSLNQKQVELRDNDIQSIIEVVQRHDTAEERKDDIDKKIIREINEVFDNRINNNQFSKLFIKYAPYAMFLLIPVFALLIQIIYFRRCRYYASQMIFSLHFHAFIFMAFSISNIMLIIYPHFSNSNYITYYFFLPLIYFIISLYVVYHPKKRHIIWKIPLIMILYAIVLLAVVVLLFILTGFLIQGVEFIRLFE